MVLVNPVGDWYGILACSHEVLGFYAPCKDLYDLCMEKSMDIFSVKTCMNFDSV